MKIVYPRLHHYPSGWSNMINMLENYKPKLHCVAVKWKPLEKEILKCNTNGALRGNSGRSSYGFSCRDYKRDLIYAQGEEIQELTNIEDEAVTIREAFYLCTVMNLNKVYIELTH